MRFSQLTWLAACCGLFAAACHAADDIVIADFEGNDYGEWQVEGDAFGDRPAAGTLPNQQQVIDFLGRGLVNSYRNGDATTGALTSPLFAIERDYLALLVGGGYHPGKTGVELLIDGQPVHAATGADAETLDWRVWDVRHMRGKRAQVRIFDNAAGGWGHINVDQIVLTNNPQASRFDLAAYRQSRDYYREPHRPQFHFSPEMNWMNDPNGLVYFEGEYHLFFQYNPFGNSWGHMSWGHAISPDLIHWQHLPVALYEEDGIMIFSGSAVIDWKNTSGFGCDNRPPMVAVYTGHQPENQTQCIAYSVDRGRTWTKYAGNPVIDIHNRDFRDPKVFWHEPSRQWVMVVVLAAEKQAQFYGSPNLKSWTLLSEFGPAGATNVPNWECPDLFELPIEGEASESRWVLHVSSGGNSPAGGPGSQYFVGQFDGRAFTPDEPSPPPSNWVDYGREFYAAISYSDIPHDDGRRIWFGWMNNWPDALEPKTPWRSAMSIPRTLSLRRTDGGQLKLVQRPVAELRVLRGDHVRVEPHSIAAADSAGEASARKIDGLTGATLEIVAEFAAGDATEFGLLVRQGDREHTRIGYSTTDRQLFVDRRQSGQVKFDPAFASRHSGPLELLPSGRLKLHIFVDRASVEVFGNEGATVLTELIFPDLNSQGVELYAEGGTAELVSLDAWKLRSVWHKD